MKTITLEIGSTDWIKSRSASKAAAVMGQDAHTSRNELLRMMATGIGKEFTDWQQKHLLDKGHASEVGAIKFAEEIIGDDLSPICGESDDGYLTASFDGISFGGNIASEAKVWNEALAASVRAVVVPDTHWPQLEQQIIVGGLEYVLFVVGDGTPGKTEYLAYRAVPGRAERLIASWRQFDADLAAYAPQEVILAAVASPTLNLPAVSVQVQGSIALISNLDVFGEALKGFIAKIPEKPSTDQEFADCKSAIGKLQGAQDALDAAEANALGQIATFDQMRRDKALWFDLARTTRLALEKLVTAREAAIKIETMQGGKDKLAEHIAALNKRLGKAYMPAVVADWAAAIKNKRTVASLQNSIDTLLAAKKIEASEIADRIDINLKVMTQLCDPAIIFPDFAQVCTKATDDFAALVAMRVGQHKAAEEKKEADLREKIRAEEQAKAQAAATEAIAKAALEQKAKDDAEIAERNRLQGIAEAEAVRQALETDRAQKAADDAASTKTIAPIIAAELAARKALPPTSPLHIAKSRPSDDEIIDALCLHFRVHESKVIEWLIDFDAGAASDRMAKEFAA